MHYKGYPEIKDTSAVKMQGTFFFFFLQKWQYCRVREEPYDRAELPTTVTATLCSQCVFKMAESIRNPAKCEVVAIIRIFHVKGNSSQTLLCLRRRCFEWNPLETLKLFRNTESLHLLPSCSRIRILECLCHVEYAVCVNSPSLFPSFEISQSVHPVPVANQNVCWTDY
jgi:hypothetical protein